MCGLRWSTPRPSSTSGKCPWRARREIPRRREPVPTHRRALREHGHEAVHVVDVDLATATDTEIVAHAEAGGFVVVTVDTDFPMLVALRRSTSPSIVLLRRVTELSPDEHAQLLLANVTTITDDLRRGAIASLGPDRLRIRDLPLG